LGNVEFVNVHLRIVLRIRDNALYKLEQRFGGDFPGIHQYRHSIADISSPQLVTDNLNLARRHAEVF
jgi:hypothetical protein